MILPAVYGKKSCIAASCICQFKCNSIYIMFVLSNTTGAPCFALPDGTIIGYPKSKVFHSLKAGLKSTPPEKICVFIADGMFLVHALIGTSPTYGVLARKLLLKVMKETTERADICFDCFNSLSIKDVERKERGDVVLCVCFQLDQR